MRKISLAYILILVFSNCGVSGTTKPTCESDSSNECDCNEEDVYSLAPETQQTVICGDNTHQEENECVANEVEGLDQDGDGFAYPEDCDDKRIDVYPGAEELCDARDNDCDGEMDGEDVCAYECANVFTTDTTFGSETEVSIYVSYTLDYGTSVGMSGCRNDAGQSYLPHVPLFLKAGENRYSLTFYMSGLETSDVIEKLVVTQIIGETPMPFFSDGLATGASAYLDIDDSSGNEETYQTCQNSNGQFIFENISFEDGFDPSWFHFRLSPSHKYSGYLQISLEGVEDFVVTGKTTIPGRPFPQQGEYVMVLCPDRDNDGQDDERCGGTDPDDEDPYPEAI